MSHPLEPDPLLGLTDRAAVDEAVAAREEERDRRARGASLATWTGTMRDLAERGQRLVVRTAGDRVHRGVPIAVGIDHLVLGLDDGTWVLLASEGLLSVRSEPGQRTGTAMGDRTRGVDRTLLEAIERLAEERRELVLVLRESRDPVPGTVLAVGVDVVTMRLAHDARSLVLVPSSAIREVIVPGSRPQG